MEINLSPDHTSAGEKKSIASQLVDLALSRWTFGISLEGDPFALPKTGPAIVQMLTGTRSLRADLAELFQDKTGKVAGQQALVDAILVLEGKGRKTEPVPLALRVAEQDRTLILDIGDLTGRAIKITPYGWHIMDNSPILFRRTALTGALPDPVPDGSMDELWELVNVAPESRPVLLAWLVAALMPDIPHPVASLNGEQGTGKSSAAKMLAALIDPSPAQLRQPPRAVDGWVTAAAGSWLVGVDNISTIHDWWSDALCRAVTGDGDVRRRLYSDAELTVFAFRRVVLLNGIDLGAVRDDLADRLLTVDLRRITKRLDEKKLARRWDAAYPRIIGALLTLATEVLAVLPAVRLDDPPRMADFARVLAAVDQVLGTNGVDTYKALAGDLAADAVGSDPVLSRIGEVITEPWEGTAAELLDLLGDGTEHGKLWPKSARAMTGILRRRAPSLRRLGWTVDDLGRFGKANAIRFLIEPPSGDTPGGNATRPASDRRASASDRRASASDDTRQTRQTEPTLAREDAKTASEASVASVKSHNLPLDQFEKEEERPPRREGVFSLPRHSRRSPSPSDPASGPSGSSGSSGSSTGCADCGFPIAAALIAAGETTHPTCSGRTTP